MGWDLTKIIPSILFGVVVVLAMRGSVIDMGVGYGVTADIYGGFSANNSLNTEAQLENISQSSQLSVLSFVPGAATLFSLWQQTKASFVDLGQSVENLFALINGDATLVLLKTVFVASLGFAVMWIIIKAYLRSPELK